MIAKFQGGPFHGQHRAVSPDTKAEIASERGNPPLEISVSEVREDVIRNVKYKRKPNKVGSAWEYIFIRPETT